MTYSNADFHDHHDITFKKATHDNPDDLRNYSYRAASLNGK